MLILAVPAFACDGDLFEPLIPLLRPDFEVETVVAEAPDMAACAAAVVAAARGRPFVAFGTSFGGHVARETALRVPDLLRGLVVTGAGAGGVGDRTPYDRRRRSIEAGETGAMIEEMARRIVFEEEGRGQDAADAFRRMAARSPTDRLLAQNEALLNRPGRTASDLAALTMPALLLWGEADVFSPPDQGERLAALLPDARFVRLEACGHLPSLETPMRVAAEIRGRFAAT